MDKELFRRRLQFDIDMATVILKYPDFFDEDVLSSAKKDLKESSDMLKVLEMAESSGANIFII